MCVENGFESRNWSGWPATRFMDGAEFLSRHFWSGWERDFSFIGIIVAGAGRADPSDLRSAWTETTMWELYALAILDELKTRANLKTLSEFGLDILYARAKPSCGARLSGYTAFRTERWRLWNTAPAQLSAGREYVVEAMASNLGSNFIGTSNAFLAHKHDLEAIGTNAHEIPMVMAALVPDDVALKESQLPHAGVVQADV